MPVVRRNPEVVARELRDGVGALLLHPSGSYHKLNRTGAMIWSALEVPRSLDDLVERIRERLHDPPPHVSQDLAAYVTDLVGRDLVRWEER